MIKSPSKQFQKFQQQPSPQNHQSILSQISYIDQQNKKLIIIAQSIMKTSFLKPEEKIPTIITQFQEDIKNIKQFFINIDDRLQKIGNFFQEKGSILQDKMQKNPHINTNLSFNHLNNNYFNQNQNPSLSRHTLPNNYKHMTSQASINSYDSNNEKYDLLIKRMMSLQQNLKATQNNQARLIQIIQNMNQQKNNKNTYAHKNQYQFSNINNANIKKIQLPKQQQSTMSKSKDIIRYSSNQDSYRQSENNFRLFSINSDRKNNNNYNIHQNIQQNIYPNYQNYDHHRQMKNASLEKDKNKPILHYNMIQSSYQMYNTYQNHQTSKDKYSPFFINSNNINNTKQKQTKGSFLHQHFCMGLKDGTVSKSIQPIIGKKEDNYINNLEHTNKIHRLSNLMRNLKQQ